MFFKGAIFWHHQLVSSESLFQSPAADMAPGRKIFDDSKKSHPALKPLTSAHSLRHRTRGAYFALSLGGLIGMCREVLTTLGLPSR